MSPDCRGTMAYRVAGCRKIPGPRIARPTLNGAILVGGASRRMGVSKAMLDVQGRTLVDRAVDLLSPFVQTVAFVGRFPEGMTIPSRDWCPTHQFLAIEDDAEVNGPLAGIAAALACDPAADWLFLPCDMPGLTRDAIQWLLDRHDSSAAATVGILSGLERAEPFPAVIGATANGPVRAFIRSGGTSIQGALQCLNAHEVIVPQRLARCWQNVNTPLDWRRFLRDNRRRTSRSDSGAC